MTLNLAKMSENGPKCIKSAQNDFKMTENYPKGPQSSKIRFKKFLKLRDFDK